MHAVRAPVWLLTAAMLATTGWLFVTEVDQLAPPAAPVLLPWWVLVGGFLLAEVGVVHYDIRREAHSFSMSELPLAFGLFFATPADVVIAAVLGVGSALVVHRRQLGLKLLFNLGHYALGACLAVMIFTAVSDGEGFTPRSWVAVLLATVVTSALSTAVIHLAISLSQRQLDLRKLPEQLALALLATVGSASLGLMGVGVTWQEPAAGWLLVVPVSTFFLAYRGYVLQRQQRDILEFLYHSSCLLNEAPDLATGISGVLRAACVTFRAELAQFAVLSPNDGQLALIVTATPEGVHVAQNVRLEDVDGLLHRAVQSSQSQSLALEPAIPGPDGHALRQVMFGPLRSDAVPFGALLVGNRLGAAGTFSAGDLRLLETLATQVSVSLENGRLARTLTETAARADRERNNALVLQRGILPPSLGDVDGAAMAVRYVPAAAGMEVGGDWYDVIQLPGGDVGVAIGDVLGHNLEAAAKMGQARSALRAYAADGHGPASLMQRLNRLVSQTDVEFMATCCYLQFSPGNQTVTLVSAGHPPPLLIGPDGHSRPVELEANLPLGVDDVTTYVQSTIAMPLGATLVLYTDGLVESRTLSLDVGVARLAQTPATTGRGDLESLADHLLELVPRSTVGDDVTLLLLRHPVEAGVTPVRR